MAPKGVEDISLLLDYEYGYGGAVYPVYNPYVLFKDGTVVKEPYVPLDEIVPTRLSKDTASNWGTWSKRGKKVVIQWRDGKSSDKDWPGQQLIPAGKSERLQGSFGTLSGGGNLAFGGNVGTFDYRKMTFTPDGWFVNKKVTGGSDSRNTAFASRDSAGQYQIDGYVITFRFNNGQVERAFFGFYDNAKSTFRIAGRTFQAA